MQKYVNQIIILISDTDSEEIKKAVEIYSKILKISPKVIIGKGHFTERSMKTKEFSELLEETLR